MSPRAWAARALLDLSGHVGALGPVLAAATARVADALADAALWASPLAECPGCGALAPTVGAEAGAVCGDCEEREAEGPPVAVRTGSEPFDALLAAWIRAAAELRVNVTTYHHRASKPEEPS